MDKALKTAKSLHLQIWTTPPAFQLAHSRPLIGAQTTLAAALRVAILEHKSDHVQNPLVVSPCFLYRELRGEGA